MCVCTHPHAHIYTLVNIGIYMLFVKCISNEKRISVPFEEEMVIYYNVLISNAFYRERSWH